MMLEVDRIGVRFGGIAALRDVSFDVSAGAIVSIIGPNGAGKTTLFNMISGFGRPGSGTVRFDGEVIAGLAPHRVARRGLVRTFQKTEVFPELTVAECVRTALLGTLDAGLLAAFFGTRRVADFVSAAPNAVTEILQAVGLERRRDQSARALSYGEQRLLEIAIGLAARPRLLMLDEPASGLNAEESARLSALLRALRDGGITIILVEHNMGVVMRVSDRIVVLHHGEKIFEGTPAEVSAHPAVIAAYLGQEWAIDAAR